MRPHIKRAIIIFGSGIVILIAVLFFASWLYSDMFENAEKHFRTAKLFRTEGRRDEAIAKFKRAIHAEPNHRSAWFYLALTYEEVGRNKEAREAWQKFVDLARGVPGEEMDIKTALSHIDYLDNPDKYAPPPPIPMPAGMKPFDINHDGRLDGFDWNGITISERDELLEELGLTPDRVQHVRGRVNQFFITDRVTRRILNLEEDPHAIDPNKPIPDVVDQYLYIDDFQKMTEEQRNYFLVRNKIAESELALIKSRILDDSVAAKANIRIRDQVYYLVDWGLVEHPQRLSFLKQIGITEDEANELIERIDGFYSDPNLRKMRIDEVYRKLR